MILSMYYSFNNGDMEKQKVMFAFNDDTKWWKIMDEAEGVLELTDKVEKVAVVTMGTAILSILNSAIDTKFKDRVRDLSDRGIDFYICINTMHRCGITAEMILPQFKIAPQGTDAKIIELHQAGYMMFTIDYI